ncbi:hypothetical protein ABZP36_036235 [Zizania latifolia]
MAGLGTGAPIVKLYHEKSMILPDVSRVLACLYEKDIKFETHTASYKSLLRLQASSHAPVPFYDGPKFLEESREICRYIAETYEHHGYQFLLGKDAIQRASVEEWLHHEEHAFNPPSQALFCHLAFPRDEEDEDIEIQKTKLEEVLEVYEQRLSDNEFLAGNKFTLADLVHLPNSHYITASDKFAYLYDSRKNVQRWWNDISTRKSWKQVLRDMTKLKEEEQHKLEELEKQKQQQWQREHPSSTGHRIRLDTWKHTGTKPHTTILVPPAGIISTSPVALQAEQQHPNSLFDKASVSSSRSTTADKSLAAESKQTTFFPAYQETPPSSIQSTPSNAQITSTSFIPSPGTFRTVSDKPSRIDADKPSIRDVSVPSNTTETDLPTKPTLSSSKEVEPHIEPTPQKPPALLDKLSETDGPSDATVHTKEDSGRLNASDFYEIDNKSTSVYSQEKESISYTEDTSETVHGKFTVRRAADSSPNKLRSTEAHHMLQAQQWHAATAGLHNLKGDIDNSMPTQEQHATDARGISEGEASSDRRKKGAHLQKHTTDEDAQAKRFQTAYDDAQDTTQNARKTASSPRQQSGQDTHDTTQGIRTYDSARSRSQPMDDSDDVPLPSKKAISESPHAATPIPTGYHLQASSQSRQAAPDDAHGSTKGAKVSFIDETIQSPDVKDSSRESRGSSEEIKDPVSTLDITQSFGFDDTQNANEESRTPAADQRKDVSTEFQSDAQYVYKELKSPFIDQRGKGSPPSQAESRKGAQATTSRKTFSTERLREIFEESEATTPEAQTADSQGPVVMEKTSSVYQKNSVVAQDRHGQAQTLPAGGKADDSTTKHQPAPGSPSTSREKSTASASPREKFHDDHGTEYPRKKDTVDDKKEVQPFSSQEPTSQVQHASGSSQEAASDKDMSTKSPTIGQWWYASKTLQDVTTVYDNDVPGLSTIDQMPTPMSQETIPNGQVANEITKRSAKQRTEPSAPVAPHTSDDVQHALQSSQGAATAERAPAMGSRATSTPTKSAIPYPRDTGDQEFVNISDVQSPEASKSSPDSATFHEDIPDAGLSNRGAIVDDRTATSHASDSQGSDTWPDSAPIPVNAHSTNGDDLVTRYLRDQRAQPPELTQAQPPHESPPDTALRRDVPAHALDKTEMKSVSTNQEDITPTAVPASSLESQLGGTLAAEVVQAEQKFTMSDQESSQATQHLSSVDPSKEDTNVSVVDQTKASQTIFRQQAKPSAPITREVPTSYNQDVITKSQEVSPDNHPTDYLAVPPVPTQEQVSHAPQRIPGQEGITPVQGAQTPSATQTSPFVSQESVPTEDIPADTSGKVESMRPSASPNAPHAIMHGEVALSEQKLTSPDRDSSRSTQLPSSGEPRKEEINDSAHSALPFSSAAPEQAKGLQTTIGQQYISPIVDQDSANSAQKSLSREPEEEESTVDTPDQTKASQTIIGQQDILPSEDHSIDGSIPSQERVPNVEHTSEPRKGPFSDLRGSIVEESMAHIIIGPTSAPDTQYSLASGEVSPDQDSDRYSELPSSAKSRKKETDVAAADETKAKQMTFGHQIAQPASAPSEASREVQEVGEDTGHSLEQEKQPLAAYQSSLSPKKLLDSMPAKKLSADASDKVEPRKPANEAAIAEHKITPEPISSIGPRKREAIVDETEQTKPSQKNMGHQDIQHVPDISGLTPYDEESISNQEQVSNAQYDSQPHEGLPSTSNVHSASDKNTTIPPSQTQESDERSASQPTRVDVKPGSGDWSTARSVPDQGAQKPQLPATIEPPPSLETVNYSVGQEDMSSTVVPASALDPRHVTVPDTQKIDLPDSARSAEPIKEETVVPTSDQTKASQTIIGQEVPGQEHGSFSEGSTIDSRGTITDEKTTKSTSGQEKGSDATFFRATHRDVRPSSNSEPTIRNLPEHGAQPPSSTKNASVEASGKAKSTDQEDIKPMVGLESAPDTLRSTATDEVTSAKKEFTASEQDSTHSSQTPSAVEPRESERSNSATDKLIVPQANFGNQITPAPDVSVPLSEAQEASHVDHHASELAKPLRLSQDQVSRAGGSSEQRNEPTADAHGATVDEKMQLPPSQAQTLDSGPDSKEINGDTLPTGGYVPATSSPNNQEEQPLAGVHDAPQDNDSTRATVLPPSISKYDQTTASQGSTVQDIIPSSAGPREPSSSDSTYPSAKIQESAPNAVKPLLPMTDMEPVPPPHEASLDFSSDGKNTMSQDGQASNEPNDTVSAIQAVGQSKNSVGMGALPEEMVSSNSKENTGVSTEEMSWQQQQINQSSTKSSKDDKEANGVSSNILARPGYVQPSLSKENMEVTEETRNQPKAYEATVQSPQNKREQVEETEVQETGTDEPEKTSLHKNINQMNNGTSQEEALDQSGKQASGSNKNNVSKSTKDTSSGIQTYGKSGNSLVTTEEYTQQLQTKGEETEVPASETEQTNERDLQPNSNQGISSQLQAQATDISYGQTSSGAKNTDGNSRKLDASNDSRPDGAEDVPSP